MPQSTRRLFCQGVIGDNIGERARASIGMSIADGTVSNPSHNWSTGMPSFTAALKTRAPSRWMESLRRRASAMASAM